MIIGVEERIDHAVSRPKRPPIAFADLKRLERPFWSVVALGVYVLRMDDSLNVKRVAIEPQGRRISVVSDNPSYPSWNNLERRAVNIVGRVLWFGRKLQ